ADVDGSHIRTLLLTFFFRHMQELIKRNNVYIAQPPLYSIKKGKSMQYIKDDDAFDKVMLKRAADGLVVRYGEGTAKIEGANLTKFMSVLKEYLNFFDKVNKRLRDEAITELLPRLDLSKHADFEGDKKNPPKKIEKLEKELNRLQKERKNTGVVSRLDGERSSRQPLKEIESRFDEDHNLWEVRYVDSQGAEHVINWELVSTAECRQLTAKFKLIEQYLEPPYIVEVKQQTKKSAGDAAADEVDDEEASSSSNANDESPKVLLNDGKNTFDNASLRELFDYVLEQGKKGYIIQRYKGLGEMTAPQLWETTMDPERRTLLSVKLEDIAECETIFTTLMGEDVEARRKFIEENALDVKNLDI
ncbi:MAG: DNA gyrase subunit B, partial [Candidatus Sulfotelmatobacter sp.]